MDLNFVTSVFLDILILPLQAVLIPVDMLLANIPGIGSVSSAISSIIALIGSMPSTIVNLFGINPFLWNALFLTFIAYVTFTPTIQMIKKIWAWVRL